jgi:hypothetical protein
MGADKLLPKTIGVKHDSKEGKELIERRSEIFGKKYLPTLRPLSGGWSDADLHGAVEIYDGPADLLARYD